MNDFMPHRPKAIMMTEQQLKAAHKQLWHKRPRDPTVQYGDATCLIPELSEEIVLVRDEYAKIWKYIEEARIPGFPRIGGLVVVGQPGIGKSLFLKYALGMALSNRIPVVYCLTSETCWLCNGDPRTAKLTALRKIPENALVLVDSTPSMRSIPEIFSTDAFRGYVVQATSPDRERWYQWAKERSARAWVMGLWTRDEVFQLEKVLEEKLSKCPWKVKDRYSPLELFDLLGPSARTCFRDYLDRVKTDRGPAVDFALDFKPGSLLLDPDGFARAVIDGNVPDAKQGAMFHRFFFGSLVESENPVKTPGFSYEVPTLFLRRVLVKHFRRLRREEQKSFAARISPFPQVAWTFYESMVVDILESSKIPHDCQLCGAPAQPAFQLGPGLHTARTMIDVTVEFTPEDNQIYIPPKGFPSLDAFVITENMQRVTFLQMTVAKQHGLNPEGIHQIIELFPQQTRGSIKWSFLFVGSGSVEGIAQRHASGLKWFMVGGEKVHVVIGWMVLQTADESTNDVFNELLKAD